MRAVANLVIAFLVLSALAAWITWRQLNPTPPAAQIWRNGTFVTTDANNRVTDAIAIEGDRIVAVGQQAVAAWQASTTMDVTIKDLAGATVLPGFVEGHGHFPGIGLYSVFANLNAPPISGIDTLEKLLAELKTKADNTAAGKPVVGMGYDDTLLAEHRHPTRAELDSVSTEHPIYIIHVSGHMGVLNSLALAEEGIDDHSESPAGGEIKRDANGELTGLLTETAFLPMFKALTKFSPTDQLRVSLAGVKRYAEEGYTTVQNGLAIDNHIRGLKLASKIGLVKQRAVLWPDQKLAMPLLAAGEPLPKTDSDKLIIGAIKFQADGSIQGYTGHLSEAYYVVGHGHAPGYKGFAAIDAKTLREQVTAAQCAGQQTAIHGNGDATIDNILDAWEAAQAQCPARDLRHVLIHAQTIRSDQLQRMAALNAESGLNISPSFHIVHPYYWGDRHKALFLGSKRARRISPTAETLLNGLRFSSHLDAPVVPVTAMLRLWAPVARQTHGGDILGAEQRISVMQSIRAMTIDPAWQMHLDDKVGSIETGKLADLVVLDHNPLTTAVEQLRDIQILETVVGGVSIYRRP